MAITFTGATPRQQLPTNKVSAALLWCKARWRILVAGAVLAIVAAGGVNYWRARTERVEADASALLYNSTHGQPAGTSSEPGRNPSPDDVMAKYPGTVAARLAVLNIARDAMDKKDWQKAIATLESATSSTSSVNNGEIIGLVATELLAYAREGAGEYAAAALLFQRLVNEDGWWDQGGALHGAARCLKLGGRADEARVFVEKFEAKDEMADDKETMLIWMAHVDALSSAASSAPQSSQH